VAGKSDAKEPNDEFPSDLAQLKAHLQESIGQYLDEKIKLPIFDLVAHDPRLLLRWSNSFVLLRLSEMLIIDYDIALERNIDRDIRPVQESEKKKKRLYLGYLGKELLSSLVLLGATDYIGSLILMRSVFELLIGIATDTTGGMKTRVWAIAFLSEFEKRKLYELWNELNPWAHPYGKWLKRICPRFYGCGSNFHPSLFDTCLTYMDTLVDLMLTTTIEKFGVGPESYISRYRQISEDVLFTQISRLKMFERRLAER